MGPTRLGRFPLKTKRKRIFYHFQRINGQSNGYILGLLKNPFAFWIDLWSFSVREQVVTYFWCTMFRLVFFDLPIYPPLPHFLCPSFICLLLPHMQSGPSPLNQPCWEKIPFSPLLADKIEGLHRTVEARGAYNSSRLPKKDLTNVNPNWMENTVAENVFQY